LRAGGVVGPDDDLQALPGVRRGQHVALVMRREGMFISTHSGKAYKSLEEISSEFSEKLANEFIEKFE
jgi:hypothetical protein